MYSDNAWPEAAGVDAFLEERKPPQRVISAMWGFVAAAVAGLIVGALYSLAAGDDPGFVMGLPYWAALNISVWSGAWCVIVAVGIGRGRRWVLAPARWTGVGLIVVFGGFTLLAFAESTSVFGSIHASLAALVPLAGVFCSVCLLGKSVTEYFQPPPAPFPTQQGPALTGNEADWVPPHRRGRAFNSGMDGSQPPPPGV